MSITTVLFDLDGTLLPMDQDVFIKKYFGLLAQKLAPFGYDPEKLIQEKTVDLARRSGTDSAQVVRLCQKLGFEGFTDLKSKIMMEFLEQKNTLQRQVALPNDPVEKLKKMFSEDFTRTINGTLEELDDSQLVKAVKMISQAHNIFLFGMGASQLAARDMQTKLLRLGLSAFFIDDVEMMRVFGKTLTGSDLIFLISFSGATEYIVSIAQLAKKNQVPIISLTNYPDSPLARLSTTVLMTTANEDKVRVGAMTSIISQFLVIDLLTSMLAGLNRDSVVKRIYLTSQ